MEFNGSISTWSRCMKLNVTWRWSNNKLTSRTRVELVHVIWNGCGNVLYVSDAGRMYKLVNSYACKIL